MRLSLKWSILVTVNGDKCWRRFCKRAIEKWISTIWKVNIVSRVRRTRVSKSMSESGVTELSLSETLSEPLSEVLKNPLFESVSADLWSLPNFDFNFTKDLVRVFDNLTVNSNHDIYTVIIGVMLWNWRKLKVKKNLKSRDGPWFCAVRVGYSRILAGVSDFSFRCLETCIQGQSCNLGIYENGLKIIRRGSSERDRGRTKAQF